MLVWIVFLPLIAALIVGFFTKCIGHKLAQIITSGCMLISAICAWIVFFEVLNEKRETIEILRWIDVGSLKASWRLFLDPLTSVMLIVVTTISSIVHFYSIGYMHDDPHIPRFMAYLSLFTFFMLMLVTSDNLIQLFFGWEGVGLCSYLLIGFWFHKTSAINASIKAFVVNRIGDFAFALGIFSVFYVFKSVEFQEIFSSIKGHEKDTLKILCYEFNAISVCCVLLFLGAMGKSAQIGLHTWLPDAMEGPTPVSALIHAATMVTAGVFLVARFSPLFEYSESARNMITYVGAITAIFAATIAITQNDIKRIIAFSTCSQLGYMFFACGVSAYSAAIFHLMTHAFFKALLFLSAGSVIHAVGGEQDIRNMGGLYKKIPITYAVMLIGSIAIAGIFPFAGYFSKDAILEAAFANGSDAGILAYYLGVIAALLTAFYSWRLIIIVFHGKTRLSKHASEHVHESPKIMLIPLFVLAFGSVFAGIFGSKLGMVAPDGIFWGKSIFMLLEPNILEKSHHIPQIYKILPLIVGVVGISSAYLIYFYVPSLVKIIVHCFNPLYKMLLNKYYFDEIYNFLFVCPTKKIGKILWKFFDVRIIDNLGPGGLAYLTQNFARFVSYCQSGYIYHYSFVMIFSLTLILTWILWQWI